MKGIIQEVAVVAIIITSSLIVINLINPTLETSSNIQKFNKAKETMRVIDGIIRELALEGSGASRSVKIISDFGTFSVSGRDDRILFDIPLDAAIMEPCAAARDGNLVTTSGASMSAYEADADSDGNTDLVLENSALKFAVRKIGSESSWGSINTTTFIELIENKLGGVNMTPTSGVYIGDSLASSYGSGYTQISRQGSNLASSSIKVFVNAESGQQYEVIFTLRSSSDFVEIQINSLDKPPKKNYLYDILPCDNMIGISPLLASIMLIAIVVTVGSLTSGWTTSTVRSVAASTTNKTETGFDCSGASVSIDNIYMVGSNNPASTATAVVRNNGQTNGMTISSAQIYNTTGSNFTSTSTPVTGVNVGNIVTLSFVPVNISSCPNSFFEMRVTTNCGGISDVFNDRPKCL